MIKNWVVKLSVLTFALFFLFGCANLPTADEMKADVATYHVPYFPKEGQAIVYIVRPNKGHGSKIEFYVYLDTKEPLSIMGYTIEAGQYICFNLKPGDHKILSTSKRNSWAEINISAKAGDIIFIKQEYNSMADATLNLTTDSSLERIQDYEGKYYVKYLFRGQIIKTDK